MLSGVGDGGAVTNPGAATPASGRDALDHRRSVTEPTAAPRGRRLGFASVLLLIVLGAFALRVGYVLTVTQFDGHLYDAVFYELEARSLADGHGFVNPLPGPTHGEPAADHPPLTALALAPAATLPGDSQLWMRLTMAALGAAVVALVGLLGRAVGGSRVGLVAATVAALYPNLWMNDGLIMSETLAALTTVAALVLAYRMLRQPSGPVAAALGAACGLAGLARAELFLLVPLLAVPVAWVAVRSDPRGRVAKSGLAFGAAVLVVAPWIGFNLARFQEPTFLSTGDGGALLGATCPRTFYGKDVGFWNIYCIPLRRPRGDLSVASRHYRDEALKYAGQHAARLPVVALARLGRLVGVYAPRQLATYSVGEGRPEWASDLGLVSFWLLVPFAVGGALWLRRRRGRVWPLLAPVWLVVGAAAVFYGTPRFRVPAEPTVVVLATVGACALAARRWPAARPDVPAGSARPPETG
jgi:4-amino-4-deoxy-L-arabinose transferase-like glycosyltransferase